MAEKTQTSNEEFIKEVNLKDGETFTANGRKYQFKNGRIVEIIEKDNTPKFNLYFGKFPNEEPLKNFPKSEDFSIKEENRCYVVDIYPLLKKIFKDKKFNFLASLKGVGYISENAGNYKISLDRNRFGEISKDLEDILGVAISNSRQFDSLKSLARQRLNTPFDDFIGSIFDPTMFD